MPRSVRRSRRHMCLYGDLMSSGSERLAGGNLGGVIPQGDTVIREPGAWTPAAHRHLKPTWPIASFRSRSLTGETASPTRHAVTACVVSSPLTAPALSQARCSPLRQRLLELADFSDR